MAIEMRGGEERRRVVLHQRLLVRLARNPEHDDVAVALAGPRVNCIGSRIPEEDERFPAHLVNRVVPSAVVHADMWHAQSQVVHVLDPGWLAPVVRHPLRVCRSRGIERSWWQRHDFVSEVPLRPPFRCSVAAPSRITSHGERARHFTPLEGELVALKDDVTAATTAVPSSGSADSNS